MTEMLLGELQARFRETTRVRLEEMARSVQQLESDPANEEAIARLARAFHALAGLGGTYGFARVSELGEEAESAILPLLRSRGTVPFATLRRWREILDAVSTEIAQDNAEILEEPYVVFDVMLVENSETLAEPLLRALEQENVTVRRCTTYESAMAELDFRTPHAAIVNLHLPDGNGLDVLERLRASDGGASAGAFVISDGGDFNDKVRAIRAGAHAFFAAPIDVPSLVRRVVALRERRRRAPARVLAVEDDPTQTLILRNVLGKAGYEVAVCRDPSEFEALLADFRPDLLLMDIHLDDDGGADVSGYDLVRLLRQNEAFAHLPVIFVSGDQERGALLESAMSGGDTLVSKPVDWALLLSQISTRLERASAAREVAERDALSGVLTRGAFSARVRERVAMQSDDARNVVAILDLDHFKSINDTHGHPAGDRVLTAVGTCLRRGVRQHDLVGRYGGEEFVLLLNELDLDDAARLVERLLAEFSASEPLPGVRVTFSAGVALFDESLESTIRRADAALYEAKRTGRARVVRG